MVSSFPVSKMRFFNENSSINTRISGNGDNKFDMVNQFKIAKFKNAIQLKEPEIGFFTSRASLY